MAKVKEIREIQVTELNEEVKTLNNCVRILEEQNVDQKDLMREIIDLKKNLKEQKFCYEIAAKRAKRYKAQLTIIREALNMEAI